MKINGSQVKFYKSKSDTIALKDFKNRLSSINKSDFESTCTNEYFEKVDINSPLFIFLMILFFVNFVLIIIFITVYVMVKRKRKKVYIEVNDNLDEKLYLN